MRLFQTMGLAEALLPKLGISRNIRHVNTEGKLLVLIARGASGRTAEITRTNSISRSSRMCFAAVSRDTAMSK